MKIYFNNLDIDRYDLQFVGVKMGDVSSVGSLRSATDQGKKYPLVGQNQYLEKGEIQVLEFSLAETQDIEGLQFAFSLDPNFVETYDIIEVAGIGNQFIQQDRNHVVVSWDKYSAQQTISSDAVIKIALTLKKDSWASNVINVNSSILNSEVYTSEAVHELQLQWLDQLNRRSESDWSAKIFPNPFQDHLNLSIHSLSAGTMNIELLDISGKVFYSSKINVSKGEQVLQLDLNKNLPAGVYLLKLLQNDVILTERIAKY